MFRGCIVRLAPPDVENIDVRIAKYQFTFACGKLAEDDADQSITHFVVVDQKAVNVKDLREMIAGSRRSRFPRVVGLKWMQDSWANKTLLDEEQYAV
jgi:DNA ligase-4